MFRLFVIGLTVVAAFGCGKQAGTGASAAVAQRTPTVEEFIASEVATLNRTIPADPDLKRLVEDIHPPATYRGGLVSSMRVKTIDGSRSAGQGGSNVSEVTILLMLRWQGPITRDGYTELEVVYNVPAKQVVAATFQRSNAMYNLATVNWFKVGYALAALL